MRDICVKPYYHKIMTKVILERMKKQLESRFSSPHMSFPLDEDLEGMPPSLVLYLRKSPYTIQMTEIIMVCMKQHLEEIINKKQAGLPSILICRKTARFFELLSSSALTALNSR